MSSITVTSRIGDIQKYAFNPTAIQRATLETLRLIMDGSIDLVDATNPFVFAIETSVVNTAAFMQQAESLTRRQYPASATTIADLYLHMADTDYANIFALPSKAKFTLLIAKHQLVNALIYDPISRISQVTIPRNTVFYAAKIPFSLQYPIIIRQLQHGGLQVVYDPSVVSPLQTLTTNIIDHDILTDPNKIEYVSFSVDAQQFRVIERVNDVSSSGGYTTTIGFTEQFYYVRVFSGLSDGTWKELPVTYTEQVYDLNQPTAVAQILNKQAKITIPVIYTTTGQITGKVRVDLYETIGPMSMLLGNFSPNDFSAEFKFLDENDATPEVAAFVGLTGVAVFSKDTTSGGRAALSFSELQTRVISNSLGARKIPITPSQIQTTLIDLGYDLVKNVDTVTNRIYWATKALPIPTSPNLVTPANASVLSLVTNVGQGTTAHGCYSHSTGMTITSRALLQNKQGITTLVTEAAYDALISKPLPELAVSVNTDKFYSSPFYYVLDATPDLFEVRPYFLDKPTVVSRTFVQENPQTGLQASVSSNYSMTKQDSGYLLTLSTNSNDLFRGLNDAETFCQLSFVSSSQVARVHQMGVQRPRAAPTDERVFDFFITTNYDIDLADALTLTSFFGATAGDPPRAALLQDIVVVFGTTNPEISIVVSSDIDNYLGRHQTQGIAIGITREILKIQFGYALPTLWNSYRTLLGPVPYLKYNSNVQKYYEQDEYEQDPNTGAIFTINEQEELVYNILHLKGDPVLDSLGDPVYIHRVGDVILDPFTKLPTPVPGYETTINRTLEMIVIDGVYQFATDSSTTAYVKEIETSLLKSLIEELSLLNAEALEQTEIYYYPSVTKGTISVVVEDNQLLVLEAAQSLHAVLYVAPEVYSNAILLNRLSDITVKTIGKYLAANYTVSISQMEEKLNQAYGQDVLGVKVSGLGGDANYSIMTVTDRSTRLSIGKTLNVQPSNQLAVKEDISIVFEQHIFGSK